MQFLWNSQYIPKFRSSTEWNSVERSTTVYKINEIRDCFVAKIKERELISKRLSKYVASFDNFDKSLIALSVTTVNISIAQFATVIGAPVGIISADFSLTCSISTEIVKKLLKTTRNKNKKHNKIVMLARSKLNSIKTKCLKH